MSPRGATTTITALLSYTPSLHHSRNSNLLSISHHRRLPRKLHSIPSFSIPNVKTKRYNLASCKVSYALHFSAGTGMDSGALLQDMGATALVTVGAYGLVQVFDNLTKQRLIQQNSTSSEARYFAAFVPLLNCLRLVINGLSLIPPDEGLVKSVTREGNPKELLRGPLYYVLILILSAILFWRESPVGVISLAMMCGGDGFADIMGRRFGSVKLPHNKQKSVAGSMSMFLSGFVISTGMLYYYSVLGYFELDWGLTLERLAFVTLIATAIESLPTTNFVDDNISVPLSTMILSFMLFS
ncbi:hypothetical protein GIB67_005710 [Kingdonia uniflora]|uniref:phytol kinase n=1 Tax=Kingdonia uniflora TaxID=39325 RepID=A0A7J7KVF7_9MAGN|nr:hypothetical protein GIB67_005710 [Kingdonia uniflora]